MREPNPISIRGVVRTGEPLSRHTSWRVGGPADRYFEPADRDDLIAFARQLPSEEPVLWLGLGSNLLVRDGGFRGTVIALHGALDALRLEEASLSGLPPAGSALESAIQGTFERRSSPHASRTVYAEAGLHCARLAKFAERSQLAGLGYMAGIPGTVGGALAMNAGAWGGETWPTVAEVEVLMRDGSTVWLKPSAFTTGYRTVVPPADVLGYLAARFTVSADADGAYAAATRASLAQRKATQPVGRPSAGSTFRNPPGDHAARLIESCGLKNHRIGGAHVSQQHANFILTEDGATAADVETLIEHIRATVKQQTGVDLHPEVKMVGEKADA